MRRSAFTDDDRHSDFSRVPVSELFSTTDDDAFHYGLDPQDLTEPSLRLASSLFNAPAAIPAIEAIAATNIPVVALDKDSFTLSASDTRSAEHIASLARPDVSTLALAGTRLPLSHVQNDFMFQPSTASVSPSQSDEVSFISGVDSIGEVVTTSYWTWNNGIYNSLSHGAKWGARTAGTSGGTVKYYFADASNWTATEKSVFVAAFTLWSDVANIQFVAASSSSQAQITIQRGTSGSGAYYQPFSSGNSGSGIVGDTNLFHMTAGTLNLETAVYGFGPVTADPTVAGGYVWGTIVHEEGHALGARPCGTL